MPASTKSTDDFSVSVEGSYKVYLTFRTPHPLSTALLDSYRQFILPRQALTKLCNAGLSLGSRSSLCPAPGLDNGRMVLCRFAGSKPEFCKDILQVLRGWGQPVDPRQDPDLGSGNRIAIEKELPLKTGAPYTAGFLGRSMLTLGSVSVCHPNGIPASMSPKPIRRLRVCQSSNLDPPHRFIPSMWTPCASDGNANGSPQHLADAGRRGDAAAETGGG